MSSMNPVDSFLTGLENISLEAASLKKASGSASTSLSVLAAKTAALKQKVEDFISSQPFFLKSSTYLKGDLEKVRKSFELLNGSNFKVEQLTKAIDEVNKLKEFARPFFSLVTKEMEKKYGGKSADLKEVCHRQQTKLPAKGPVHLDPIFSAATAAAPTDSQIIESAINDGRFEDLRKYFITLSPKVREVIINDFSKRQWWIGLDHLMKVVPTYDFSTIFYARFTSNILDKDVEEEDWDKIKELRQDSFFIPISEIEGAINFIKKALPSAWKDSSLQVIFRHFLFPEDRDFEEPPRHPVFVVKVRDAKTDQRIDVTDELLAQFKEAKHKLFISRYFEVGETGSYLRAQRIRECATNSIKFIFERMIETALEGKGDVVLATKALNDLLTIQRDKDHFPFSEADYKYMDKKLSYYLISLPKKLAAEGSLTDAEWLISKFALIQNNFLLGNFSEPDIFSLEDDQLREKVTLNLVTFLLHMFDAGENLNVKATVEQLKKLYERLQGLQKERALSDVEKELERVIKINSLLIAKDFATASELIFGLKKGETKRSLLIVLFQQMFRDDDKILTALNLMTTIKDVKELYFVLRTLKRSLEAKARKSVLSVNEQTALKTIFEQYQHLRSGKKG